jgi:hypothetical protein
MFIALSISRDPFFASLSSCGVASDDAAPSETETGAAFAVPVAIAKTISKASNTLQILPNSPKDNLRRNPPSADL